MKFKILFLLLLLPLSSFGFEINTHQAITSCALSKKCININEQQGAENLNYFALTMQLNNIDYKNQVFEQYDGKPKYFEYAMSGKGLGEADKDDSKVGKQIAFKEGKTSLQGAFFMLVGW